VDESVPATYPPTEVDAIHAPEECKTGYAIGKNGKGMENLLR
jgi:hypothetical protein